MAFRVLVTVPEIKYQFMSLQKLLHPNFLSANRQLVPSYLLIMIQICLKDPRFTVSITCENWRYIFSFHLLRMLIFIICRGYLHTTFIKLWFSCQSLHFWIQRQSWLNSATCLDFGYLCIHPAFLSVCANLEILL